MSVFPDYTEASDADVAEWSIIPYHDSTCSSTPLCLFICGVDRLDTYSPFFGGVDRFDVFFMTMHALKIARLRFHAAASEIGPI